MWPLTTRTRRMLFELCAIVKSKDFELMKSELLYFGKLSLWC